MKRRTEEVVAGLVADLRPVRRLAPPGRRAVAWVAAIALVVGAAVAWAGLRPDLAARLALPHEAGQWMASVATGASAAVAAFVVALPDRSPRWALLPVPALAAWVSTLVWGCFADVARLGPQALSLGPYWGCLVLIAGLGLPLLGSMLWVLRHAAPVGPARVGLLAGLAAGALCSAGESLVHDLDPAFAVLVWHGGAVLLVSASGAAIGRAMRRP